MSLSTAQSREKKLPREGCHPKNRMWTRLGKIKSSTLRHGWNDRSGNKGRGTANHEIELSSLKAPSLAKSSSKRKKKTVEATEATVIVKVAEMQSMQPKGAQFRNVMSSCLLQEESGGTTMFSVNVGKLKRSPAAV